MMSKGSINNCAMPTRRFSPPDNEPKGRSINSLLYPPKRPAKISRTPESLAHSCVFLLPMTTSRTVAPGSAVSTWLSIPSRAQFARVTRPSSGGSIPASTLSSVDFPPPLRPTIPIRSPSETPRETFTKSGRISKAFETPSILMMLRATGLG